MNDPGATRKAKGWPLLAISLLVVLLAGFLVLKWRKKDEGPAIVKEAPVPTKPVEPAPPDPTKVTPEPPTALPKAGDAEFEKHLKALRKAIEDRNWDDAAAALGAAKKLRADDAQLKGAEEQIAEGRKKEEQARLEIVKADESRRKRDRAWAVEKERIEKDERGKDLWDAAIKSLDKFKQDYSDIERDDDYGRFVRAVKSRQAEADALFEKDFKTAQEHLAAGRYAQAISTVEGALIFYPEREPVVRAFEESVREAQMEKSMVRIPATTCWIGSDKVEDEKPLRQVKLPAFLIDKYEVSNEDYYAFTAATGRPVPVYWLPARKPPKPLERHPVFMVTWDDAVAYAKWAGKRLPTAEEWEVAARGIDKREFPWGDEYMLKDDKYACNCLEYWQVNKSENPGTRPVDSFETSASAFGVYNMGGNVWEWTSTAAPATGSKPPPEFRVLKGGSFMTPQKAIRCANVYAEDPRLSHVDVGFRCVRDVK